MGIRDMLERVSKLDTGRPQPIKQPKSQLVVVPPFDPVKTWNHIRQLQNELVLLETDAGRVQLKVERIIGMVERKLAANAEQQARVKDEQKALREKLVPWCQDAGLYAGVPE